MAVRELDIFLDRDEPCYLPNDIISGKIVFMVLYPEEVINFELALVAKSKTKWHLNDIDVLQKETILNLQIPVRFYLQQFPYNVITTGTHVVSFSTLLPATTPPSIKTDIFLLGYQCVVRLQTKDTISGGVGSELTARIPFEMSEFLDLNTVEDASEIAECKSLAKLTPKNIFTKVFNGSEGDIMVEFSSKKQGMAKGELISIRGMINNRSNRRIRKLSIIFLQYNRFTWQNDTFESGFQRNETTKALKKLTFPINIAPLKHRKLEPINIEIPANVGVTVSNFKTFSINYGFEFRLDELCSFWMPCIIGTVPIEIKNG